NEPVQTCSTRTNSGGLPWMCRACRHRRCKRRMGMTPNEAELFDVENHYPTDRIPMEMKEKSVAENLLDKMAETQ
ncbi:hypothetical protein CRUP_004804, partial [Coryphaenoides rupestris]